MTQLDTSITSNGAADLDKVIALFTGPNSADLFERHVAAISRLCHSNSAGFAIRDLPKVQQVLELSLALLKRGSGGFEEALCELVGTFAKPFVRRTATDEFKMLNHITSLLTALGDIFRSAALPTQLVITAAQTVTTFANAYGNRPNALDLATQQPAEVDGAQRQYHTNQSLLNKSGIVADVLTALARSLLATRDSASSGGQPAADPDDSAASLVLAPLCGALLAMSYNADNCSSMVECGVLQCLAALLSRGSRSETVGTAVEMLWNVLELAPEARTQLSRPLPPLQALARGAAVTSSRAANGAGAGGDDAAAAAGPGPGSTAQAASGGGGGGRDLVALASFSGMLGPGASAATAAVAAAAGASAPDSTRLSRSSGGAAPNSGGVSVSGGPASDHDEGWQPLPDGAAGGGAAYEASISLRAAAIMGGGAVNYDEFADTPDLDLHLVESGFVTSSAATGAAGASAATTPSTPAPAPVVQALADALTGLLRSLLLSGFSRGDKELRNDIMVALNLLLEDASFRAAAAYAGVFEPLLAAGTAPELAARPELVASYALTTDTLDHELRLLTWSSLVHGCLLPQVLDAAVAGGLMRVLLLYVSYGDGHPAVRRWNPDQLATLRSAALSKLHSLSPLCPDEYERAGGPATLLGFVQASPGAAHLEAALRHLHRLFSMVPESRDAAGVVGLIPVLLGIAHDTGGSADGTGGGSVGGALMRMKSAANSAGGGMAAGTFSSAASVGGGGAASGAQPESVRHFALLCLTALCSVHAENQRRLRKAGGVTVLLSALARLRSLDPLLPAPYAVAVLDCIWGAVVPDRKSTARFLVDQGLDYLLNHLEEGNRGHRVVVLRVLSDLLENPRSHPFFHEWRSGANKQTAAHLLLTIWMEEDTLRGMTGPDGLLANTARPLVGLDKRTRWLPAEAVAYGNMSPEKKEVLTLMLEGVSGEVALAKIWGIFKLLGFDSCPYLDPRDHATLAAVEKYAKFRQGEVWRSIQSDFDASDIRPTAPDRVRLESGIELAESLAVAVREAQARLLGRAQDGMRAAEARLFEGMRQQARLEAEYRTIALQESKPLTLEEMRRAKESKAAMLKNSLQSFQFQHGDED
ncbi:hypothetical protein GPECTOR_1g625 [Gonium pectorale]|uniref:Cilia- and flagella-associated protein 69 ARM repeats domain-containing protein n=1 Tax=Gonium pectorale TaxID=33097 RepID=A0A150H3R9_GONPE|nr:hypothetical protein GPECTOR_1g625 [Gonium pectorale]|eukprot:KXZ56694.1 hypothetical protein GPECTOR_1g625 [Gonium pectorale]